MSNKKTGRTCASSSATNASKTRGWGRLLNDLYKADWSPFHNFFHLSMKLLGKIRIGSRYSKRYEKPQTPCERLLQCPLISHAQKEALRHRRDRLDPFLLKHRIEEKLAAILEIVGADMGAGACPRSHVA